MTDSPEATNTYRSVRASTNATWLPRVNLVYRRWLHISLGRPKPKQTMPSADLIINLEFLDDPLARAEF